MDVLGFDIALPEGDLNVLLGEYETYDIGDAGSACTAALPREPDEVHNMDVGRGKS